MSKNSHFSDLIQGGMKRKDISLRGLCRQSGVDASFFSKVLSKKRNPPTDSVILLNLARILDLNAEEVFIAAGRIPENWEKRLLNPEVIEEVSFIITRERKLKRLETFEREDVISQSLPEELL
jgi:transcriptional regulator with XRE-family HTH domain